MNVTIRPLESTDLEGVLRLTPRLLVGVDPSRSTDRVRKAVEGWVDDSVKAAGTDGHAGWVAVLDGAIVGFVSVSEEDHWSVETDAWIGELMVAERCEGHGVQ
jgi:hypothetical protein